MNLDAYDREESRDEAQHLAGLTPKERKEFTRALYCGHAALHATWRQVNPGPDGRLHACCPECHTSVSRSAFTK